MSRRGVGKAWLGDSAVFEVGPPFRGGDPVITAGAMAHDLSVSKFAAMAWEEG